MKLVNGILRPGRILELGEAGEVKVDCPGLFTSDDKDNLPYVHPFFTGNTGQYSQPEVYDEVWVLNFTDNPDDVFWFKKDDYREMDLSGEEVEIICNREIAAGWATIKFTDGSGWVISRGHTALQLDASGGIVMDIGEPYRKVHVHSGGIDLGGNSHPAAYGDKVVDCLEMISTTLEAIRQAASANVYTTPIGTAIGTTPNQLKKKIRDVISPNVNLE